MPQKRLYLTTDRDRAEAMFALLDAALESEGLPIAISEPIAGSGVFETSIYVDGDEGRIAEIGRKVVQVTRSRPTELDCEDLPEIDWVAKSLEGLGPVRAGRFVVHGRHQRAAAQGGAIGIEVEAGQAFGTGHHGTTSGCLMLLDRIITRRRPRSSLDLGAGSAVLAIAIARQARTPVLATDIDPVATAVGRANARINGVHGLVRCVTAPGFAHRCLARAGPFDLIVANILARPLMALAPDIARHLAPGGDVVLSGILSAQRWRVLAAFRTAGLSHRWTIWRDGWVTLHLRR